MRTLLGRLRNKRNELEKDGNLVRVAEYTLQIDAVKWAVGDPFTQLGQRAKELGDAAVAQMPARVGGGR
jgi:hypothetical protein